MGLYVREHGADGADTIVQGLSTDAGAFTTGHAAGPVGDLIRTRARSGRALDVVEAIDVGATPSFADR